MTAGTAAPATRGGRLNADAWRLLTASLLSSVGDGVKWTALPLLAASITRDPAAVSAVTVFEFLPWLLFALPAGALVDRWDRRRVLVLTDLVRGLVQGGLAVAVAWGGGTILLLCAVGFVLGTAQTMFDNASQAILPAVVDAAALPRANSVLSAGQTIGGQFAGPPLGALLFATAAAIPFGIDAASFLVSAALLVTLPVGSRGHRPRDAPTTELARRRLWGEVREGAGWLVRHGLLRRLCVLLGVLNLVNTMWNAIGVLWALQVLHLSVRGYGLLSLGEASGALLGAIAAERMDRRLGRGRILRLAFVLELLSVGALALVHNGYVAGTILAALGFSVPLWNVATVSLRQEIVPAALLGRVNSAYRFVGWGTMPLGGALGGALASVAGLRAPFVAGAAMLAVTLAVSWRVIGNPAVAAARVR